MKTIFGIKETPLGLNWPVVTVGGFDGVHRGHQKIITKVVTLARQKGGEAVVLTFATHPKSLVSRRPRVITSLEHKLLLFERLGVDLTVVLEFSEVEGMSAEDFIKRVVAGWLGVKAWVMGFNFAFGKDRKGDFTLASNLSSQYGYEVHSCLAIKYKQEIISSTRIRETILRGELEKAKGMLGRPVSLLGTVIKGSGRGRNLGYPTANLDLHHEIVPPKGVYATLVRLGGKDYPSLTSIGSRPTFEPPGSEEVTEVYILDLDQALYGQVLEVHFLFKLRDEIKFESPQALKAQMDRDKEDMLKSLGKKTLTRVGFSPIMLLL
ncbi:MAG: bifunctional riboflavin kinase/FAD synthetase [Candidatus Brocadiales bacterium]|nr:bifunctional riboflavin kinase/FAD synthetase [Candidatus Brocadiales bacterium]